LTRHPRSWIRDQLEEVWSISRLQPQRGRCILNFYGRPGTGKTRAALGAALRLEQPLYQVDYSAVVFEAGTSSTSASTPSTPEAAIRTRRSGW